MAWAHCPASRSSSARCSGSSGARGCAIGGPEPPSGSMLPFQDLSVPTVRGRAVQADGGRDYDYCSYLHAASSHPARRNKYTTLTTLHRSHRSLWRPSRQRTQFILGDEPFQPPRPMNAGPGVPVSNIRASRARTVRHRDRLQRWGKSVQDRRSAGIGKSAPCSSAATILRGQLPATPRHAAPPPRGKLENQSIKGACRRTPLRRFFEGVQRLSGSQLACS
jgi:hypothetical protein